jgi:hypothetical protein
MAAASNTTVTSTLATLVDVDGDRDAPPREAAVRRERDRRAERACAARRVAAVPVPAERADERPRALREPLRVRAFRRRPRRRARLDALDVPDDAPALDVIAAPNRDPGAAVSATSRSLIDTVI